MMDLFDFSAVSFGSGMDIKCLRDYFNELVGVSVWHDTFTIPNTSLLWLVSDTVSVMNSGKMLCGVAGMCPGLVADILNQVNGINFYVLCNESLTYSEYIERWISVWECTIF
jgi:hypothetical protein